MKMSENNDYIQLPPLKKDTPSDVVAFMWKYMKVPENSREKVKNLLKDANENGVKLSHQAPTLYDVVPKEERIIEIEIERLRPFKEHPFQVKDDKEMFLLQESIEKYGILNPLIVRPVPDGYYEIISGHRRKHAAEKLGYRKVPVIIRVLSEDDSILSMVDSNLHRERISYSEKAFAYKLKNDVLKRKSGRKKSQVDHKTPRKRSIDIISEDCGDSPKQVQRYISLTKLIPEMLQKLDDEIISFCPAVEIAALKENEQRELLKAMDYAQAIPSLSQAQRIKQLSKEKQLSLEKMEEIMSEVKKGEITRVAFTNEQLHKYFPNSYTPAMMKREILALLKLWKKESWES